MKFSWLSPPYCPVVVAHRGSSGNAPENTMAAFRLALKEGADAIELDVHLSKDGHPVVIHDVSLDRTTDGSGKVRNYTLQKLKKFNAASGWENGFSFQEIPTLDSVLRESGPAVGINIEIKWERTEESRQNLIRKCVGLVRKYDLRQSVLISSFDVRAVKELNKLDRQIIRGLLYDPLRHPLRSPAAYAKSLGVQYLILSRKNLMRTTVSSAHKSKLMIGVFTVKTERQTGRSLRREVDAIFTDYPARVITFTR